MNEEEFHTVTQSLIEILSENERFDLDEDIIPMGVGAFMAQTVYKYNDGLKGSKTNRMFKESDAWELVNVTHNPNSENEMATWMLT